MRPLSPLRSPSPITKPRITFNYPPSPLRERPTNLNPPASPVSTAKTPIPVETKATSSIESIVYESQKCNFCQKIATHKAANDTFKCCSSCAMQQIRRGSKIVRIQLKDQPFYKQFHQKIDKENGNQHHGRSSSGLGADEKQKFGQGKPGSTAGKVQKLVRQAENLKEELQTLMSRLQDKQFASQGIRGIYRQKKLGLKNHYEKIKATIKVSIERDLAELEKRQRMSLECLEDIKMDINSGLYSLQQIGTNLEPCYHAPDTLDDRFDESLSVVACMEGKKRIAGQILEQLSAFRQGEDAHSDSLQVRLTQQQIELAKAELYDPTSYTLLLCNTHKKETLFSFQRQQN